MRMRLDRTIEVLVIDHDDTQSRVFFAFTGRRWWVDNSRLTPVAPDRAQAHDSDVVGDTRPAPEHNG